MYRGLFILLFLFLLFKVGNSQLGVFQDPYIKFDHYSSKEGLSSNYILDIIQDGDGFLWVATKNGLNKFNGYDFKTYYSNPSDSLSLTSDFISSLAVSSSNVIWIGTPKGVNQYNPTSNNFKNTNNNKAAVYDHSNIRAIQTDMENNLWIENADGLLKKYKDSTDELDSYKHGKPSMVNTYFYHDIHIDKKGIIWVGGRYMGLYAFNPVTEKFKTIPTDPNDSSKKRDPDVAVYFTDSRGVFWIGGTDGLYTYDQETDIFKKFLSVSTFTMAEDWLGQLWIGTGSGLYIYNPETKVIHSADHDDNNRFSLSQNHITKIFIDKAENVWIGTIDGLNVFRPAKNKFRHIYHVPGNPTTPESNHITSILEDHLGNIWLGTSDRGIDVFNPQFNKIQTYSADGDGQFKLASVKISFIKQDKDHDIWIGQWSGQGMNIINPILGTNKKFRFLENALMADWYSDFLHDGAGNYWIGIWGAQGLYKFDKTANNITDDRFAPFPGNFNRRIKKISFDGRRLWLAFEGQKRVCCFDTKSQRFNYFMRENYHHFNFSVITDMVSQEEITYFKTDNGIYKTEFTPYLGIILTNDKELPSSKRKFNKDIIKLHTSDYHVNAISPDENNIIWVATNSGLIMINGNHSVVYNEKNAKLNWVSDTIYDLAVLPDKKLALATEAGLVLFDMIKKSYFPFPSSEDHYLSSRLIKFLFEDRQGMIWVGNTEGSLNRYEPYSDQFTTYKDDETDSTSFWGQQASCAVEDLENKVWIGGKGLNIFDPREDIFRHITENDGLANNDIQTLQMDKSGNIWASTSNGISQIDPYTNDITNYYEKDGLQSNDFSGASYAFENGRLAFGGKNGLNLFNPNEIYQNRQLPEVRLVNFKIFEIPQQTLPADGDEITLSYNQNYFSFEFTALDFSDPENNQYAYKLENLEDNWITTASQNRIARYTNVDAGHYVFKVKASNSDGVWNDTGISIPMYIRPPFWKTTGFYILIIILLVSIIIFLIKYREKKIKEQNKLLLLEQKLLRSQMNPHFIFNSLSSIQSFIFENDPMKAGSYLSQFAELIRSILYNSREEFISLEKELNTLKNYLELQQLRYNNNFDYSIEVDERIDPEELTIPPMLAQPFIENAIEHGIKHIQEQGKIEIKFLMDDHLLTLIMQDNGIGLEAAKKLKNSKASEHQSLATIITKERIDILNKSNNRKQYSVSITELKENNKALGTRVIFKLPIMHIDQ